MKRVLPISMLILGAMLVASQASTSADGAATMMSAAELQGFVGACGVCVSENNYDVGCTDCKTDGFGSWMCSANVNGKKCVGGMPDDCHMSKPLICSGQFLVWEEADDCSGNYDYTHDEDCSVVEASGEDCEFEW